MEITITKRTQLKPKPDENNLVFGTEFTDHMFIMDYTEGKGWHDAKIVPYGPIELSPAAMVLHYAQEVFEGMKAYKTPEGDIQFFRPMENFARMNRSNARMCIPQIDEEFVFDALKQLSPLTRTGCLTHREPLCIFVLLSLQQIRLSAFAPVFIINLLLF